MSKTEGNTPPNQGGYIIRPYITLRNGKRIFAANYGKKGFVIPINPDYEKKLPKGHNPSK